jgi:diketogulonate reductase-like aldo/keto reductase
VPVAIKAGYRLIDTATIYKNEEAIGEAVEKLIQSKVVKRDELFIESKLSTFDQGFDETLKAVELSLKKLRTAYIDLYIIHWPGASKLDVTSPENLTLRKASWQALEQLYKSGKLRSIGVSNYTKRHLEEMKDYAKVMPMINQIEIHPLYYPGDVVDWCRQNSVVVQAYSSLARGLLLEESNIAKYSVLKRASERINKKVSQVLLRWAWQHDFCIIPKSVSEERIVENADLDFVLSDDEMQELNSIHIEEGQRKVCWDPEKVL